MLCRVDTVYALSIVQCIKHVIFREVKNFSIKFCPIFSFLKILKIRDNSFIAPLILRYLMPKIGPSSKTVPRRTILAEPYFASKSIEHDVTLTSFLADL